MKVALKVRNVSLGYTEALPEKEKFYVEFNPLPFDKEEFKNLVAKVNEDNEIVAEIK